MPEELKRVMEMPGYAADGLSKIKKQYAASGGPDHTRYGWVRTGKGG